jgi:multidrug efflux pump subunit AcrB
MNRNIKIALFGVGATIMWIILMAILLLVAGSEPPLALFYVLMVVSFSLAGVAGNHFNIGGSDETTVE